MHTAHLVRHGLEEDGGGRDLGLGGKEAMRQMATVRQVQPQNPTVRLHQGRVHSKVGRRAAVRLHIDAPGGRVQPVELEGARLRQPLQLIDELVAAVVAGTGQALAVLVVEAGAQALQHGQRGEVFAGDHLQAGSLAILFLADQIVDLRIGLLEGVVERPGLVVVVATAVGGDDAVSDAVPVGLNSGHSSALENAAATEGGREGGEGRGGQPKITRKSGEPASATKPRNFKPLFMHGTTVGQEASNLFNVF